MDDHERHDMMVMRAQLAAAKRSAFTTSEGVGKISAALAKAQGAIEAAKKDRLNTFFTARYATLAAVWEACRAALSANGLAVVQSPVDGDDETRVGMVTLLSHESGEWMRSEMTAPVMPQSLKGGAVGPRTPQSVGSALTYLRRYALAAMVGVSSDDDDGAAASNTDKGTERERLADAAHPSPPADLVALEATYVDALAAATTLQDTKRIGVRIAKVGFEPAATKRLGVVYTAALARVAPKVVPTVDPSAPLLATAPDALVKASEHATANDAQANGAAE